MKISIFLCVLLLSTSTFSCPGISGSWRKCYLKTNKMSVLELTGLNFFLKSYIFNFSNPTDDTLLVEIIKDSFFSEKTTIHSEITNLNQNNYSQWDKNVIEGSTPPELTTYSTCKSNGMTEYITWENLSVENYPDHAKKDFPKYFKSIYEVSGNQISRNIYSRKNLNQQYEYFGTVYCTK